MLVDHDKSLDRHEARDRPLGVRTSPAIPPKVASRRLGHESRIQLLRRSQRATERSIKRGKWLACAKCCIASFSNGSATTQPLLDLNRFRRSGWFLARRTIDRPECQTPFMHQIRSSKIRSWS